MERIDGRKNYELRPVTIKLNYQIYPLSSALIMAGNTRVVCSVFKEDSIPSFLQGTNSGWITSEYSMLPGSGRTRVNRNPHNGRSLEIQRLIGRSLRAVVDLEKMPEITLRFDCDVIQADGGTRTASITCAYVVLMDAIKKLMKSGELEENPVREAIAAISVGKINGELVLDLCYEEDSEAEVDMNVVMTESGNIVEIQGTAEKSTFSRDELMKLLDLAESGIKQLIQIQKNVLSEN